MVKLTRQCGLGH